MQRGKEDSEIPKFLQQEELASAKKQISAQQRSLAALSAEMESLAASNYPINSTEPTLKASRSFLTTAQKAPEASGSFSDARQDALREIWRLEENSLFESQRRGDGPSMLVLESRIESLQESLTDAQAACASMKVRVSNL